MAGTNKAAQAAAADSCSEEDMDVSDDAPDSDVPLDSRLQIGLFRGHVDEVCGIDV